MSADWLAQAGMEVAIAGLGTGVIIKPTQKGALVSITASEGMRIELTLDKLAPILTDSSPKTKVEHLEDKIHEQRRVLEALRFGLVPQLAIKDYTLGYDELSQWVMRRLPVRNHNTPGVYEIRGPFGTGKSHTMGVIRQIADEQGYIHARVEVDGQNISFCNPSMLLVELWKTLSGKTFEAEFPMLELYTKALKSSHNSALNAVSQLQATTTNLKTIAALWRCNFIDPHAHILESILIGGDEYTSRGAEFNVASGSPISKKEIKFAPTVSKKVSQRPASLVESLVGTAKLAAIAGYQGLVITIDEFEVEYIDPARLKQTRAMIKGLSEYFSGDSATPDAPISIFLATVGQGSQGDDLVTELIECSGGDTYELTPWSDRDLLTLSERLHQLYCDAYHLPHCYDVAISEQVLALLLKYDMGDSGRIRAFIKSYIATLDIKYGPPGNKA